MNTEKFCKLSKGSPTPAQKIIDSHKEGLISHEDFDAASAFYRETRGVSIYDGARAEAAFEKYFDC